MINAVWIDQRRAPKKKLKKQTNTKHHTEISFEILLRFHQENQRWKGFPMKRLGRLEV